MLASHLQFRLLPLDTTSTHQKKRMSNRKRTSHANIHSQSFLSRDYRDFVVDEQHIKFKALRWRERSNIILSTHHGNFILFFFGAQSIFIIFCTHEQQQINWPSYKSGAHQSKSQTVFIYFTK